MGLFFTTRDLPRPASLRFTLDGAGHTYEDGQVGLEPTSLAITERRVAVIGLNGSGKSTLLGLLDGSLDATRGTVTIQGVHDAGGNSAEETLNTASKRDRKRIDQLIGRVRREEIPNAFYRATTIGDAVDEALKKHKVPLSERQARIGNLFAHFSLADVSRRRADELDSEKRHLLAIAAALSFDPSAIVADEPSKGLDEIGTRHVAEALFGYDKQVVFATHDTAMITRPEYAIDRALVLDDGSIAFDGAPAQAVEFYERLIRDKAAALRA
ncbi:ATP-binding cassette domain-containing protein [Bifidobacterium eulemuris]|uniref:ABC transporter ATP-binding protein n=1 Tax=Bifidobacterium eulemuris TaxID=1765219 RepID=A0A261GBS6_9BIFI|nr:energy-coupling factor ABC transporter ATP-binding protein [Bifidobacterium eulemuris]OZG68878.1 ABC transporter ATP-binding protein [Bifidobacterium eulemuris]QOL31580.1 ATP-binding cassette domain-containing protein [Bifidobacterium eulemuris]